MDTAIRLIMWRRRETTCKPATLVLAYAGSAIPLLLLVSLSGRSVHHIVTGDEFAEEALRSLIGGLGLQPGRPGQAGGGSARPVTASHSGPHQG
jgi:hypothetical protein